MKISKLHLFIISTDNKEELDEEYEKMVALMKQVQEESSGRCISIDFLFEFRSLHGDRVTSLICREKCGSWCTCLISNFY